MNLYMVDGHAIPAPNLREARSEFKKKYGRDPSAQPQLVSGKEPVSGLFGTALGTDLDDELSRLFRTS